MNLPSLTRAPAPSLIFQYLKTAQAPPVVVHFNCLGRGGGHDAKRATINATGLWLWRDKDKSTQAKDATKARASASQEKGMVGSCGAVAKGWAMSFGPGTAETAPH